MNIENCKLKILNRSLTKEKFLKQVRSKVSKAFKNPPLWVHNFYHVKRVVGFGRKIVEREGESLVSKYDLFPKLGSIKERADRLSFLVELACWLHDLGRTIERKPTLWGDKFNHAAESERMARKMLYEIPNPKSQIPNFEKELVLQAVAEHNQPTPKHSKNIINLNSEML